MWNAFTHKPLAVLSAIFALALGGSLWAPDLRADSDRIAPAPGYAAQDFVLRQDPGLLGILYSGGLAVAYANVSHAADGRLTRCFLHVESRDNGDAIRVTLHDDQGRYRLTLCEIDTSGIGAMPQCVKLDPLHKKVWFSYTVLDNTNDRFYTFDWDPGLSIYPQAPTFACRLNGNWEIAWSRDSAPWDNGKGPGQGGRPFFAATGAYTAPNAIWVRNADAFQKVIQIGGAGCGFAFDNQGNLWSGAATCSGDTEPLFMWTATDIDTAARSGGSLVLGTTGDPGSPDWGPTVKLDLPSTEGGTNFIPSDVACDPDGNVYVSCNTWILAPEQAHTVVVVDNHGMPPWPGQQDMHAIADAVLVGQARGFRALCYDGDSNLDAGGAPLAPFDMAAGNRLFVDMDFGFGSNDPDEVVGLSTDHDEDADSVPDALDNCRQTVNADQADTDHDGIGDVCEGDCDTDGKVDTSDLPLMAEVYGTTAGATAALQPADLDGDGDVDGKDLAGFAHNITVEP